MGAPRRTESHAHLPDPYHDSELLGYFQALNNWHGYIRLLGLPHLEDTIDEPLKNLFVEPYVHQRHVRPEEPLSAWADGRMNLLDVMVKHKRVVLLGDPGFGKSTLVSWIAWNFTRWDGGPWVEQLGPLVPIPLVVRELPLSAHTTWDECVDLFCQHGMNRKENPDEWHLSPARVRELLAEGRAIILVDGLDEIGQREVRDRLSDILKTGMAATPHCVWLITSRIVGYDEMAVDREVTSPAEQAIAAIPKPLWQPRSDVARVYCCPFDDDQISRFAYAWFMHRDSRSAYEAEETTRRFLDNLHAAAAPLTLARIPNLLTMFALVYRVLAEIPHGRSVLYAKVAEAYLDSIDKSRGFKPRFQHDRMERWLAFIAFHLQQQRRPNPNGEHVREILIHRERIVLLLSVDMKALGYAPSAEEAREFIDYVARRSGLLIPRGEDFFAFMHLSFQEYFAARFLQTRITAPGWDRGKNVFDGTRPSELREYTKQHAWRETLLLLFEIIEPEWATELLEHLFLPLDPAPPPAGPQKIDQERLYTPWQLLTEMVINPHTQLNDAQRRELLTPIVEMEIHEQSQDNQGPCCRGLLSATGFAVAERQQLFWAKLQQTHLQSGSLVGLDLSNCSDLADLTPITCVPNLSGLYLNNCPKIHDLSPLQGLFNLRWLVLQGCANIGHIRPLAGLSRLGQLSLRGCHKVDDLQPLIGMRELLWLDVSLCPLIVDLSPLNVLHRLAFINLGETEARLDLRPLEYLPNLVAIVVSADHSFTIPVGLQAKVRVMGNSAE